MICHFARRASQIINHKSQIINPTPVLALVVVALVLGPAGCGRLFKGASSSSLSSMDDPLGRLRVVPQENSQQADLGAADILRVLERVGFSDEEILQLGPALHHALLTAGAAEIRVGKKAEMAFAINGERLFITSRRGTFVYNFTSGRFGAR